ncbi:flavodoxin domain-containing protein [Methylocystis hirsuta]|uniref:Protoporphyrinogen oxidase n=1 Tax=Methylocystis hirsuta TaxID=369798 RepID=A0A3M9XMM5_9HYPH|nr:flavodoxin domain-containing protein [Methylocystis hirsuta]RNJ48130.1 protoporphyrinogen oxidase [Methylocystis hirsuta]
MKPILIVYGATKGQTPIITEFLAERLRKQGNSVDLVDSATNAADQVVPIYVGAIIGGSMHYEKHQTALTHFVKMNLACLNTIPTAFFSVNLAMLEKDEKGRAEAKQYVDRFLDGTGLKPIITRLIAGALKYTQYDFFKRFILRHFTKLGLPSLRPSRIPNIQIGPKWAPSPTSFSPACKTRVDNSGGETIGGLFRIRASGRGFTCDSRAS